MPLDVQKQGQHESDSLLAENKLFCASCGHWITHHDWKTSVKEAHEHTVFNPAGIVFTIGCFLDAPGCWATGQPSDQFTWFPTYKWRLALCEGCGKQLGWLFTGSNVLPVFYGLILNRLTDKPDH